MLTRPSIEKSDAEFSEDGKDLVRKVMTNNVISNARSALNAASLVFAQSILDDCAWSYLCVCALSSPEDWDSLLGAKKIDFNRLRNQPLEEIRGELISAKLGQLERESLMEKVNVLFRLCVPPPNFRPIDNYVFEKERLERIDGQRHKVIHSSGYRDTFKSLKQDLEFIFNTGHYLTALVNMKFGVQIDPAKVLKIQNT